MPLTIYKYAVASYLLGFLCWVLEFALAPGLPFLADVAHLHSFWHLFAPCGTVLDRWPMPHSSAR